MGEHPVARAEMTPRSGMVRKPEQPHSDKTMQSNKNQDILKADRGDKGIP